MSKRSLGMIAGAVALPVALLVAQPPPEPPDPEPPRAAPDPRAPRAVPDLDVLGWLAGCWLRQTATSVTEELWTRPAGGIMVGLSRTVGPSGRASYEHLLIEARGDDVVYVASPSSQALTEFTGRLLSDSLAVFENPGHDFPQRILYRRSTPDSLHARIEGPGDDGTETGIDFRYGRTACP